jgi:hypothetical protein
MQFFTGACAIFQTHYFMVKQQQISVLWLSVAVRQSKQRQHFSDKQQLELPDKYKLVSGLFDMQNLFCNIFSD